ncbi:MAG: N-acetylneuraminate synthase family protein [Cyclobacteriaceae bacterium]|nr:N-acetylneuraminate synthase family protein [Cyclobacteriaceae bacterium]
MFRLTKPLIVFEMANNHMGDVDHGLQIIESLGFAVAAYSRFDFAIKFQYREIDDILHPSFRTRLDMKFVKRFQETKLNQDSFRQMLNYCKKKGFKTICTPFDGPSVDRVLSDGFDYLKIASCSILDWPLLERIAEKDLPIIASTGGTKIQDLDRVVAFLQHKQKKFALMHCVGIYPTPEDLLVMNRIDWLSTRYGVPIGFSTHEDPSELQPASIAVAKGAEIFEKHVGIETQKYKLNRYSASPDQIAAWLDNLEKAFQICGPVNLDDFDVSAAEESSLRDLKRGVFAKRALKPNEIFTSDDVFFAMPVQDRQMTSEQFSKHNLRFVCNQEVDSLGPIIDFSVTEKDLRGNISAVIHQVKAILRSARIVTNPNSKVQLSHHHGIEEFETIGATLIECINRDYCKKLIVQVPGQFHPEHYHDVKEETFQVLWGDLELVVEEQKYQLLPGDIVTVFPKQKHSFRTKHGVVFEEVSTTHRATDSSYTDTVVVENSDRKTDLLKWLDRF